MKKIKTACSLDCWDTCSIEVTVYDDKNLKVRGDHSHSITQGFLCQKGMQHLERVNSPHRITSPMKKIDGNWINISWDQALEEIAQHLRNILNAYGASSLLLYSESGHCGLKKNIDTAFFNSLGKVTLPIGSLCWGAGIAAQKADFGKVLSHPPQDLLNSRTVIIWGRNPVNTNVHLVPFLKKAKEQGANIVVIDPIKTATAHLATHYYQIKPESDGHLALAMAKILINDKLHHMEFLNNYCDDFASFEAELQHLELDSLIEATGLTFKEVKELAFLYGMSSPSSIILGYGLQRYPNGGRNIRLIDALAAVTGNIGVSGGGVSYANQFIKQWIDWDYLSNHQHGQQPSFIRSQFYQYILEERPDEIKGMFITKGNPLLQLPNTNKTKEAFDKIPFKVTIDLFMTDTAAASDYILPCTHIFEEEDFLYSSMWHSHFFYTQQVLPPRDGVKNEFEIFNLLAQKLNMVEFVKHYGKEEQYLERGLGPLLANIGLSLKELQGKNLSMEGNEIPWRNKQFATSTKKYQFINLKNTKVTRSTTAKEDYPLQLLSLHPKHSLHSQHFNRVEEGVLPKVYCNRETLNTFKIIIDQPAELESQYGKIKVIPQLDEGVGNNLLLIYEGWWLKNQGVNTLTPSGVSDIGNQAIYNHCFCRISSLGKGETT
ncbi:molybdopterin-dependent oxidoreductase [Alkaliphilus transvaalensis]|uniref:molybdopterin-dependent oxidoreductase n=1 Tax=Alkaliphilus transvaalensis TaxID=114628 RepID=UPI00047CB281|nr:molybdopterin-dependent oxidoreductase [Alkaliphilus transvaalensis]